jgi:hypothetical protein
MQRSVHRPPRWYGVSLKALILRAARIRRFAMSAASLTALVGDLLNGRVKVVDLTQTLSPDFPVLELPPQFGQCAPLKVEQVSKYDEAGPGWYWNNFSCNEHTGTHFDAPIHWITGRDLRTTRRILFLSNTSSARRAS